MKSENSSPYPNVPDAVITGFFICNSPMFTLKSAIEDYVKTAEIINELDKIPAIELNISCPNVKQGGMAFGVSAKGASEVVKAVRSAYKKTLIVKLSPNVTDITEIARAAEESGADSVSLINTLLGMAIDAERKRPILSTITGGMSGAAVKPIALRMVWQVAKAVNIPVIGLGGIMDWKDAVEFMLAGATAIQIGTANFIDPADYKGWKVPDILLSGHEAKIKEWELQQSLERTRKLRPDLLGE